MADQAEQYARTEDPTPKRLADARKKGDAPKSQEVNATMMLMAAALAFWMFMAPMARMSFSAISAFIDHPHDFVVDAQSMTGLFKAVSLAMGAAGAGIALLFVATAVLANIVQAAPVFTVERMKPKLSKLSPIAGAKRVFGPTGLVNFGKGVFKILIVGSILIYALWPDRHQLSGLIQSDERALLTAIQQSVLKLLGFTIAAMAVISALDYGYQRHAWMKRLRMTKEEVKRELKESEGDPIIKAQLRQQREARARRRMMVAVPDATVLIMNPTHFAVALRYDDGDDGAPICVAKGQDDLALRMRAVARENDVPVIEDPPLARALHASVEIDDEIPVEHFEAVAKIIGFIFGKSAKLSAERRL